MASTNAEGSFTLLAVSISLGKLDQFIPKDGFAVDNVFFILAPTPEAVTGFGFRLNIAPAGGNLNAELF